MTMHEHQEERQMGTTKLDEAEVQKHMQPEITKEAAIARAESGWWKGLPDDEIVKCQLFQDRLTMGLTDFYVALSNVLGRTVLSHELAFVHELRREYLKLKPAPSLDEVLNLIPAEKRVVVVLEEEPPTEEPAK